MVYRGHHRFWPVLRVFGRLAISPPAIAQSLYQNQALLIDPRQEFEFEWSFAFTVTLPPVFNFTSMWRSVPRYM